MSKYETGKTKGSKRLLIPLGWEMIALSEKLWDGFVQLKTEIENYLSKQISIGKTFMYDTWITHIQNLPCDS